MSNRLITNRLVCKEMRECKTKTQILLLRMLFTQNVKKNSMMIINNHLLYLIVDRGFIFHLKKLSQSPTIWVVHIVWKMRKKNFQKVSCFFFNFYSLIDFFLIAKILQINWLLQKWNRVYKELVYLNRYKNRF